MASDTLPPDLTLLGGTLTELAREQRLLRLQVDNIAARLAGHDTRFAGVEASIHGLIGEMSRGFGQQQQQLTRIELRLDAVQAGLTGIGATLADNTRLLTDFLSRS